IDAEFIEKERNKWRNYISSQTMTPTEIKLAEARAKRASEMAEMAAAQTVPAPKSCRPITALYTSPRTTSKMKKVFERMHKPETEMCNEVHFQFCHQCGFVRCRHSSEEHYKMRRRSLKQLLIKYPSLVPKCVQSRALWGRHG
ncbi:hypothetical protein KR018_008048, partial [Drosophila ironensis]